MCPTNDLEALKAVVSSRTCAVITEPILGEGGILPSDKAFMEGGTALCDEHDALLIFDEVQLAWGELANCLRTCIMVSSRMF